MYSTKCLVRIPPAPLYLPAQSSILVCFGPIWLLFRIIAGVLRYWRVSLELKSSPVKILLLELRVKRLLH
jgi:hypothetical protein